MPSMNKEHVTLTHADKDYLESIYLSRADEPE